MAFVALSSFPFISLFSDQQDKKKNKVICIKLEYLDNMITSGELAKKRFYRWKQKPTLFPKIYDLCQPKTFTILLQQESLGNVYFQVICDAKECSYQSSAVDKASAYSSTSLPVLTFWSCGGVSLWLCPTTCCRLCDWRDLKW